MAKVCPNCKTVNVDNASFCQKCGKELSQTSQAPPTVQTQKSKGAVRPKKSTRKNIVLGGIGLLFLLVLIWGGITLFGGHTPTTMQFSNAYVSFNYPGNWYVSNDSSGNGNINIALNDSNDNGTSNVDSLSLLTSNPTQEQYELASKYQYIYNNNTTATGYNISWYNLSNGVNYSGGLLSGSGFYSGPTSIGAFIQNGTDVYWLDLESSNSNLTADDSQCYSTIINSIRFK